MVIKASGVPFEELTPETMVVCDFDGLARRGRPRRLERRGDARLRLPALPHVGGVAHTHSAYATALAARAESRSPAC